MIKFFGKNNDLRTEEGVITKTGYVVMLLSQPPLPVPEDPGSDELRVFVYQIHRKLLIYYLNNGNI